VAPLYYVSPTQINYVLPPEIHGPFASVSIERTGLGIPVKEEAVAIPIFRIAPGLFTLNSDGLPAATAIRVNSDGSQSSIPVFSCSAASCEAVPIDVSQGDVYLSLFGTGFSLWDPSFGPVPCITGNGAPLAVTYAGPQNQFAGLDQLNILLPSSLAGEGNVSVQCQFQADGVDWFPEFTVSVQ
jgi:uncharacterized protein (TIGR03437 family)